MNTSRISCVVLGLLAAACAGPEAERPTAPAPAAKENAKEAEATKKRKPKFTVGKDTTHVTGPLDEDGYINYVAALNQRLGEGVKPTENAVVLLWRAFGPRPTGQNMPPEFFRLLSIEPPPEKGDYFISLERYLKERHNDDPPPDRNEIDHLIERTSQRAWTAKDFPRVAAWLKANEKPLALIVEATKRPKYYSPLAPERTPKGSSEVFDALMPGVMMSRNLANALAARAMLHAGEGRTEEAWQDLLACHRLARQVGRGGTLIEGLVGVALDSIATGADLALVEHARPHAKRLKGWLRDVEALPPVPQMADKIALGERFFFLDSTMMMARGGVEYLEQMAGGPPAKAPTVQRALVQRGLDNLDWDPVLRSANRWYDRMVAAMRLKDRRAREEQLDKLERELKALRAKGLDLEVAGLAGLFVGGKDASRAAGQKIGDLLICLLMPALRKVQQAGERQEQVRDNLRVALAVAAYRHDRGRYPEKLEALAPAYLAAVPKDRFSGKALVYRPSEKGYLLYSVGANGKDEEGRWYDDDPPGDDPGVRVPLPPLRRR
jgi:hypothetical protein